VMVGACEVMQCWPTHRFRVADMIWKRDCDEINTLVSASSYKLLSRRSLT
jgi:hypothetical protein